MSLLVRASFFFFSNFFLQLLISFVLIDKIIKESHKIFYINTLSQMKKKKSLIIDKYYVWGNYRLPYLDTYI